MKIVRTDRELEVPLVDRVLRGWGQELVLLPDGIAEEEFIREMADCELLLTCYTPVTKRVVESAPLLRGIVKYGVGIDAIDIPAAHARGIAVVNIPEYAENTVAEGAFAMLMALAKKLPALHMAMMEQGWVWPSAPWLGSDIAGKTVGIVGCGRIGRNFARMAGAGFQARVVGYDPNLSSEALAAVGIKKIDSLVDLLSQCDFVSLHATLSTTTQHLIGKVELAAMKSSAFIINSARGALIDENALLDALREKRIAGAGLDVFSREPLNRTIHPLKELYGMENVVLMPHLTFYTVEAMERLEMETLERCREIIEGKEVIIKSRDPRLHKVGGLGMDTFKCS